MGSFSAHDGKPVFVCAAAFTKKKELFYMARVDFLYGWLCGCRGTAKRG
jgi:hypothetical protein